MLKTVEPLAPSLARMLCTLSLSRSSTFRAAAAFARAERRHSSSTPHLSGETNLLATAAWTPARQHACEDHESYW